MFKSIKNGLLPGFVLVWMALGVSPLAAQPAISGGGVLNAASPEIPGLARGGYFSIFGRNLGVTAGPVAAQIGRAHV